MLHPRHALGLTYLLLASLQPLVIEAELNGVEVCENRCFNRSECHGVGNGLCCQWNDESGQCISSIGSDICPGTTTTQFPAGSSIDCPPTEMSLGSARRNLSEGFTDGDIVNIIYIINATLSILFCSYVIQDILCDPQKRNESTYHRIMLGLSCSDIILSFYYLFEGIWIMMTGRYVNEDDVICNIAGFFNIIGDISSLLYSCSLATFYLLKLKYSWVNSKVKAIEKWLLFLPCTTGLIAAVVATVISILTSDSWWCG